MPVNEECREKILSNDYYDVLRDFLLSSDMLPPELDACVQEVSDRITVVYVNRDQVAETGSLPFSYNSIPKLYTPVQDYDSSSGRTEGFDGTPLERSGILDVQQPPLELTGRGVIIGFVDTGIDYRNPAFRYSDGSSKIYRIWDQTIQTGEPPAGFDYGSEYTKEQIDEALRAEDPLSLVPSVDEDGHGTAVAGLAAASVDSAAPGASIIMVKLKPAKQYLREYYLVNDNATVYSEADIMLAVRYINSFVELYVRPVVICFALGSNMTDHGGQGLLSQYLGNLSGRSGRAIVVAGGNEGNARHHYYGVAGGDGNNRAVDGSSYDVVEIQAGENENGFFMEMWGRAPDIYTLSIRSPGGELIPQFRLRDSQRREYTFLYDRTRIIISYDLVEWLTGDLLVVFRFINPTPGVWRIMVHGCEAGEASCRDVLYGTYHMWLPVTGFVGPDTYFLEPNPDVTLTSPSNTENLMGVSTYNSANNSFYINSGRGYTRTGRIKPDFAAPGVDITVVRSDSINAQMRPIRYERRSGSCYAAAIVSGACAQFFEWAVVQRENAEVSSYNIRNYFIRGSIRDSGNLYPNREWGFGRFNLKNTFDMMTIY